MDRSPDNAPDADRSHRPARRARRKRAKTWRERLGLPRHRDGWYALAGFAVWVVLLFLIAIDPLVDPHVARGKGWWLSAIFSSWRLTEGGPLQWLLLIAFWTPTLALMALVIPGIIRAPADERRRAARRIKDRERHARKRAERLAQLPPE